MFSHLMTSRRFAPLFWCQFFSAFNDNFLKNSLVFLILYRMTGSGSEALITLAGATLILPFFLLSSIGGEIADRYDKAIVARWLKLIEIPVALFAVLGFWLHSIALLFVALFLIGVIAALFGPIKYGILPDHLQQSELPAGNALVEGATFLAILLGTIVGGLAAKDGGDPASFAGLMMVVALLCWLSALLIPRTGQGAPNLRLDPNIVRSTARLLGELKADRRLWWSALVVSWFWLTGAIALSLMPPLIKSTLGAAEEVITVYLAVFSIGIAAGSALAAWLASGRIVLLPTVLGAGLLGILCIDLGWWMSGVASTVTGRGISEVLGSARGLHVGFDLFGMAVAGGLFIVPAFSAMQAWAGPDHRARVIAANNVLNAAFMVAAGLFVAVLQLAGLTPAVLFMLLGLANLVVGWVIFKTLPTNPVRDFLSTVARAIFRAEVRGLENVEKAGPNAIMALNHVSFLDAPFALSILPKDPVFAIDCHIAERWWVKPFLRFTRAMPIDPTNPWGTRQLIRAVQDGESLIIFPEGRITVTGSLMKIYDGAGLIADKSGAMVLPVRIKGLEQTPFSRLKSHQVRRRLFPKISLEILEPVRITVDPELRGKKRRVAAGAALYQVMSDLIYRTQPLDSTIPQAMIKAGDTHGMNRIALQDPVSGSLTYRKMLIGAAVLGRKLAPLAEVGEAIGVLLPNSNGVAVTLIGLMWAGRVPAMLNFSAGPTNVRAACKAAKLTTVVTSRAFVEKGRLDNLIAALAPDYRIVYLEDVRQTVTKRDKIRGLLEFRKPLVPRAPTDPAAVLFTSGSEGVPKGVVLAHSNILANAAQAKAVVDFGYGDKVFNVLPVFHAFGLTIGFILPMVHGVTIYMYPSPLHYRLVPELIYATNATVLFGTDTFLNGYARTANAYDLRSLRYVMAGAEPVKDSTRRTYNEKFGLRVLEGYGVTEAAPAIALNTPMFNRFGSVGRLFPGMEARLDPVPGVSEGGRLFIRGPNVMIGYMRVENPGVIERPPEGWHDTGDIVSIDADGFIFIKGRAKRFAKVGGEMISLAATETLAFDLWPDAMHAVATIPDARKGERLIMVTTQRDAGRSDFAAFVRSRGLSEMLIPAEFVVVEKLPLLGSGKVDNLAVGQLVRERYKLEGAA
ncbi:acyl-[ACP]--phospholipid O-acyltransferase [Rhodoplanes serenus]|uniref:Acyl-[ACP]--phospholipid O-acyltransferase n=1 Tax=Rhodoplanes serenus TaxID=200615 RepID=A0A9X5ARU0_9BRAD|nr:acyl-[ACP]--phospholipid O-acyltransferase [Rhodoplanes serenus]MTW16561.1 acyl-[ACP]--phospholipid O-acyltransferase [Rhodoplanes serenus]